MRKILPILLLAIWMSCSNDIKPLNDKLITPGRIGNIKIGEKYSILSKLPGIESKEVDLSGKMFKNNIKIWYGFEKDNFQVYAQKQKGGALDFVKTIICESKEYRTQNRIHVGMTIQELRKIYPDKNIELKGGMTNEIGYYIPNDLVARNQYGMPISKVILKLSTEQTPDTTITSIIVGTN